MIKNWYRKTIKQQAIIKQINKLNILHTQPQRIGSLLRVEESTCLQDLKTINPCEVGFMTYFGGGCEIRNAKVGRYCSIGKNVTIGLYNHPIDFLTTHPICFQGGIKLIDDKYNKKLTRKSAFKTTNIPVTIENDVWIGHHAIIKSGVIIHTGAIVGAGAVVTKDVPPYAIVAGNPAKIFKYRFEPEVITALLASKWWTYDLAEIEPSIGYDNVASILEVFDHPNHSQSLNKIHVKAYQLTFDASRYLLQVKNV